MQQTRTSTQVKYNFKKIYKNRDALVFARFRMHVIQYYHPSYGIVFGLELEAGPGFFPLTQSVTHIKWVVTNSKCPMLEQNSKNSP